MTTRYPSTQASAWEQSDLLWTNRELPVDEFTKASIHSSKTTSPGNNSNSSDDDDTQEYQPKAFRGRTRSLVLRAKLKHRSDLKKGEADWTKFGHHSTWRSTRRQLMNNCVENVPREHVAFLSMESFRARYEYLGKPCVIQGLADDWDARTLWTYTKLREDFGDESFKCGEDDDGYPLRLKLKHFFRYQAHQTDDSPLYIFDSTFDTRVKHESRKLLQEYEVPSFFKEDLFQHVGLERRPPHRWMLFGPERSGSNIHVDPLGTSAWNTCIQGRKLWVLYPPHMAKRIVRAKHLVQKKEDDEPLDWFMNLLPRIKEKYPETLDGMIQFIQMPGETVFVPSNWWHTVLNLDDTIAVTQNFASTGNFSVVWKATREGRSKMARRWRENLRAVRPDLADQASRLDATDGFDLESHIKEKKDASERKKRKEKTCEE